MNIRHDIPSSDLEDETIQIAPVMGGSESNVALDLERLARLAKELGPTFRAADPFPHVVVDGFFAPEIIAAVLKDFPTRESAIWTRFNEVEHVKLLSRGDSGLAPSIRRVVAQLRSVEFLGFLERLVGIEGLVADPHAGGCHVTEPGGYLNLHVDATWNDRLALYNAVNLFVYLNEDWQTTYGGDLELWDARGERCVKKLAPKVNRMVIFSTSDTSLHGHPVPLASPPGRPRRSLAANYCTSRRPPSHSGGRQSAVYRANAFRPLNPTPKHLVRLLTPPLVFDVARRWRAKLARSV